MPRKSELSGILRRGSACLSCRRRKLRCDGQRPVCNQCTNMKRTQECRYDDSSRKSRTQSLREKLFTLEAKVRELEYQPGSSKHPTALDATHSPSFSDASIELPSQFHSPDLSIFQTTDTNAMFDLNNAVASSLFSSMSPFSFDQNFDSSLNMSTGSSPSHSDGSFSTPLQMPAPLMDVSAFADLEALSDRSWSEGPPTMSVTAELHTTLLQSFITHRKQCCFYNNTTRLEVYAPPNGLVSPCLMSSVYLMGCFFAPLGSLPDGLEQYLLDQTLQDVAKTLHRELPAEQLLDVIQALALLAQYLFFNNREMEANRHLMAASRISADLELHNNPHPDLGLSPFDLRYTYSQPSVPDGQELNKASQQQQWEEKTAVFWHLFMVQNLWSVDNECTTLPDIESAPSRYITTPFPVVEGAELEATLGNSTIAALFHSGPDSFRSNCLSMSALKAIASCIFDKSIHIHNSNSKDGTTFAYHRATNMALKRLTGLTPEFTGKDAPALDRPGFDTDLFMVRTLILASTILLQVDNSMDLKISRAAEKLVELVNHLSEEDYQYLDPALAVCWSSIIKAFLRMMDTASKSRATVQGSNANFPIVFLKPCVDILMTALSGMRVHGPLAGNLLASLDTSPLYSSFESPLPSYFASAYVNVGML